MKTVSKYLKNEYKKKKNSIFFLISASRVENFLKIVKRSGLFNRDMRVAPISMEFKKTGTYERPIWGALNSNSEAFSEFS